MGGNLLSKRVEDRRARHSGPSFATVYTAADVRRLADVDEAYGGMSGLATCEILRREFEVHGDPRFERRQRGGRGDAVRGVER